MEKAKTVLAVVGVLAIVFVLFDLLDGEADDNRLRALR